MDNQAGARQPYRIVTPPSAATMACKRAFDILCSFLGLTVLSPVMLVVSVLVAVTSPGGVFFRQERIGKDGRPFRIFKFRSMRKDNAGLKITTGNDSRITPVGRFLRKSKIDELPQLINVLVGDMSFVGPRPEVADYVNLYTPYQRQVLLVRPGITGLASIRFRNENDLLTASDDPNRTYVEQIMPRKIDLDLEYIPHASVFYDIKLIFQTFAVVIKE